MATTTTTEKAVQASAQARAAASAAVSSSRPGSSSIPADTYDAQLPTTFTESKQRDIVDALKLYEPQIAQCLPRAAQDLTADRIIQISATVIARDPKLKACDHSSIVAAVMQAAILGLNPLPQLAECYYIPYGGQCVFQIGYRGWLTLYYRSEKVREVYAYCVKSGDEFSYSYGLRRTLVHVPKPATGAKLLYAYAVLRLMTGGAIFIVLSEDEIEQLRLRSPLQKPGRPSGAWLTDPEAMWFAKVLKQLRRHVPSDGSLNRASASDDKILHIDDFAPDGTGLDLAKIESAEEVLASIEEAAGAIPAEAPSLPEMTPTASDALTNQASTSVPSTSRRKGEK